MPPPARPLPRPVGQSITITEFNALVDAYRENPGRHTHVAKVTGLNYRTARKAWEEGIPQHGGGVPIRQIINVSMQSEAALRGVAAWAGAPDSGPPPTGAAAALLTLTEGLNREQAQAIVDKLASVRASELALLDETRANAHATQAALGQSRDELVLIGKRIKEALAQLAEGKRPNPEAPNYFDLKEGLAALKVIIMLGKVAAQTVKIALEAEKIVINDLTSYIEFTKPAEDGGAGGAGGTGEGDVDDETLVQDLERDAATGGSARHLARIRAREAGLEVLDGGAGKPVDPSPEPQPPEGDDAPAEGEAEQDDPEGEVPPEHEGEGPGSEP